MQAWKVPTFAAAVVIGLGAGYALGRGAARPDPPSREVPSEIQRSEATSEPDQKSSSNVPLSTEHIAQQDGRTPSVSALKRLLGIFNPGAVEQGLHVGFVRGFQDHPDAQARLFEMLMKTDDDELIQAGRIYLHSIKDPELLQRIVSSFEKEGVTVRRDFLAYLLGANCGDATVAPVVEKILSTGDSQVLAATLSHIDFGASETAGDSQDRIFPKIRALASSGLATEVRQGAVRALFADKSEDGTRLLAGLLMNDADPTIRRQALSSMSISRSNEPLLQKEQVAALWFVASSETADLPLRLEVARRLIYFAESNATAITTEQRAYLKSLVDKKN